MNGPLVRWARKEAMLTGGRLSRLLTFRFIGCLIHPNAPTTENKEGNKRVNSFEQLALKLLRN